jgi:hypothetical protein
VGVLVTAVTLVVALAGPASALPAKPTAQQGPLSRLNLPVKNPLNKSKGDGKFHVVGNRIIGPGGGDWIARGVNLGGLEWSPNGYDLAYWNFKRMKDWGVNFVRVALSDVFWLKSMCSYNKNYAAKVDQIVQWGKQLKMLILLDDHHGTAGQTCGTGKWHNIMRLPDIHNLAFVKALATRYKNEPYVAIDLYNEPHDIPDSFWRDGGLLDGYRGLGMQQMVDGVRSTGYTGLVVATGNGWGNDLRMVIDNPLSNDKNLVYGAHTYPYWCDGKIVLNEPYWCRGKQFPPQLESQIPQAAAKRAVIMAEFGTYRPIAGEVAAPIRWAEEHRIGWAAWLWCNGKATSFCLLAEGGGNNPSVIGQPVRDALRRATGK